MYKTSFWFVIKDSFGGMEELSSKMRNQVRKSLKTYDVCRVSASEMLRVGFPIFQTALEKTADYTYDCILLDIMLPDGNGLDLLEELKEVREKRMGISSAF